MARQRKRQVTDNGNKKGTHQMAGLTSDQIAALLSKTRTKGQYLVYLNQFIESGEGGVSVSEQWADLAGKKATTVKQGFEGAKDKKEAADGADKVRVVTSEDQVFLINLGVVGEEAAAAAA